MKKFIQKKLKEQKGMTLIELLAVIVIIAIIAAIAIPAIGGIIDNSRVGAIKSDAQNMLSAGNLYFTDAPADTEVTLQKLQELGFVDDIGSFETDLANVKVFNKTSTTVSGVTTNTPMTISGKGVTGKLQVIFTKASRDHIEAYGNSKRGENTEKTVNASKN